MPHGTLVSKGDGCVMGDMRLGQLEHLDIAPKCRHVALARHAVQVVQTALGRLCFAGESPHCMVARGPCAIQHKPVSKIMDGTSSHKVQWLIFGVDGQPGHTVTVGPVGQARSTAHVA